MAVVGFSVFVAADDLTVVSTMLRPIIGDLGLVLPEGLDDAAWVVNAYLIAFVAVMPIAGRISDVVGRRRTFMAAYATFVAGSVVIPLSVRADEPFGWFLLGRVLTAIGGGAMVPVALAVVGDVFPADRRARALGTLGAIETMGWVWGPLYGSVLVRFLSWEWQFWLNVPLGLAGLGAAWWALADHDRPARAARVDWLGAALLTAALVSLNVALLGSAEIQSVEGFDELRGDGADLRWLGAVSVVAGAAFVVQQRRSRHPLLGAGTFGHRSVKIALVVDFVVGAALVIAMVDVPLFVNAVEVDVERAAVLAGWILSALTAAMALASYAGGRWTERTWFRPPALAGAALGVGALAWMGATWDAGVGYPLFALQLALLGAGFGLTVAPTTSAVVERAAPDERGAAASVVMVVRLLGFSVGLSALTAWGLARFDALRSTIDLPPLTDPGFEVAVREAQATLTARSIAETFSAAAVVMGVGLIAAGLARRTAVDTGGTTTMDDVTVTEVAEPPADAPGEAADAVPHLVASRLAAAQRRTNLLIGALGLLVAGAFVAVGLLAARATDARDDAATARAELELARADLERVEAGAALYASQIEGFREQLVELEPQISAGVEEAITGLRSFGESTIEFEVSIDEVIPVETEVVIDRVVQVPIRTTIPIDQSFDTTIRIDTPLGRVPLDVTVPVDVDVPVDLVVDVPIKETVPISDEFPVQLDVPIAIDVSETELASLTDALATGLESLQEVLTGLSG